MWGPVGGEVQDLMLFGSCRKYTASLDRLKAILCHSENFPLALSVTVDAQKV